MPAPKGNRFWEARSTHGRKPIFASPDDLWSACVEYFEWVEDNPLYEVKVFNASGSALEVPVAKMRAMTVAGVCNFLDIDKTTWDAYGKKEDFSPVITRARQVIDQQKYEGAAADLLNPNIIARDLGLHDRLDVAHSGGLTINLVDNFDPE